MSDGGKPTRILIVDDTEDILLVVSRRLKSWGYGCYTYEGENLVAFERMDEHTVSTNFFFAHPDRHAEWLAVHGLAAKL